MNHRLRWCFKVCLDLGIDDPLTWMNQADPTGAILDSWIAYHLHESEAQNRAESGSRKYTDMEELRMVANAKARGQRNKL